MENGRSLHQRSPSSIFYPPSSVFAPRLRLRCLSGPSAQALNALPLISVSRHDRLYHKRASIVSPQQVSIQVGDDGDGKALLDDLAQFDESFGAREIPVASG